MAPAVRQFVTEDLGAAGTPADVSAEQAAQQIPSTRMYHGTSSEFASVDPSQIAGENNLYGPGYYLTSDPQVAGGVVARGDEQVGPSWLKSGVTRAEGDVISPGYAQSGGGANAPADVARAGPNVRAVDVPQNLNLLNIDGYVQPADLDAIRAQLPPNRVAVFDSQIARAFEGRPTGQQVWDALNKSGGNTLAARAETNRVLAAAGFDGLEHSGGQRIPMQDAAGRAIQHDVNVIFPSAVDKVTNAVSGTQGGQIATPFAARLGGAVAGGAVGYQTTPDDATPQERALRTAAGAGLGFAGGTAAERLATSGFRAPDSLTNFLSDESGALTLPPGTVRAVGRAAQAARIGALAGGVQTLGHIALNTPVQIGLKMASDLGANLRYPEANAAEAYGAMQGLRHWGMNAASTLAKPGPLASSMGGGAGAQALETGLTGLVKAHPLLQDIPRQMATQMELYRTAAQAATDAGLPRLGAAWRAEVARLVASPTADMTSAAKSAGDTAALAGPMGTTGQAVSKLIKDSPVARFAVPIFDIGYRVASQGVEMTPLGTAGILADVGRAAIGEGPYAGAKGFAGRGASDAVTPLAQRVRNNMIGLALMYEGYQQAAQGNITGEGPADPGKQAALRETGWQPDSVKVGGRYFNAHLLGALGWPLIAGANTFESMNGPGGQGLTPIKTPEGERAPGALDMLGDYVARQGRYFNNETFLNSLGSALNLIGARAQQGQVPANEAANVLQSLIPQGALLANIASSQDPYQRNPKAGATPIEDHSLNQIASRCPITRGRRAVLQLQPQLTATRYADAESAAGPGGRSTARSSVGNP